jgi:MinD-like ATPase involved in chromosome partitioning or flagellar assembly
MALICVTSAHGAPGTTTLSLLAAGCWPRAAAVVEADPSGGVLAVRYALGRTPGLADLVAAVDTHAPASALWSSAQSLPGGLRVVPAPESGEVTVGILDDAAGPLARWLRRLEDVDVIVDCGRSHPGSPAVALMGGADAVLVVVRATADQIYPSAYRAHALAAQSGCPYVGLVLVGDGPYRPEEVATQLQVPVLGVVTEDARTARSFAGGGGAAGRAVRRSPLVRSVNVLVEGLAAQLVVPSSTEAPTHRSTPPADGEHRSTGLAAAEGAPS